MRVFICQEGSIAHISSNCIYFSKEILMLPCYKRTYGSHGQHCSCLLPKRNHMLQWWIQAASLVTVLRTSKTVSVMLRVSGWVFLWEGNLFLLHWMFLSFGQCWIFIGALWSHFAKSSALFLLCYFDQETIKDTSKKNKKTNSTSVF